MTKTGTTIVAGTAATISVIVLLVIQATLGFIHRPVPVPPDPLVLTEGENRGLAGFIVQAETKGKSIRWEPGANVRGLWKWNDKAALIVPEAEGQVTVSALTAVSGEIVGPASIIVTVGPRPPPIPGPGPGPGPGPPPSPAPSPAPIPDAGFRVLVVYDAVSPEQVNAASVRAYLNSKCVKAANGTPEFRVYPKDVVLVSETELWKKAFARPRASLPWVVISTGTTGYEGVLPSSVDDTLKLLQKYGGN